MLCDLRGFFGMAEEEEWRSDRARGLKLACGLIVVSGVAP